mgnify:CR=1 FL=1
MHVITILEIKHLDKDNNILWEDSNLKNTFHTSGEEYFLKSLFIDQDLIPSNYYFGLDNRTAIEVGDTIDSIDSEPISGGYQRQSSASEDVFTSSVVSTVNRIISPVLSFSATTEPGWGPVNNLFMTTSADDSGYLVSTVRLSQELTLSAGQTVTLRMGISLTDDDDD